MRSLLRNLLAITVNALASAVAAQDTFTGVDRIVAVGDVHGDYDQFLKLLQQAGVANDKGRWIGGRTHLVQTGDVLDRGPDSRKVMELLMSLTPQAQRAGGRVHALIGNHEVMNVLGDLRYVSAGEFEAFRSGNAKQLRDRAFAVLGDSTRRADAAYRTQWDAAHPLGWVEHRLAFEANGRYASWLRQLNAVIRIDDYLFLHGGIGPKYATWSLPQINRGVQHALRADVEPLPGNAAEDNEGPLWYRGLALGDESLLGAHVDQVLAQHNVRHLVIGHTVTPGTVWPRHGGKVLMIDVGLSAVYGGPPACLIITKGVPYTLHRGQQLLLPLGTDLVPYARAAAALDPPPSKLLPIIDSLAAMAPARKTPNVSGGR